MRSLRVIPIFLALTVACSSDGGPSGPAVVRGALAISAGAGSSCAIGSSGGLACWGMVPEGTHSDTTIGVPVSLGASTVTTPAPFTAVSLAPTLFSATGCGVAETDQVYCWGALVVETDVALSLGGTLTALPSGGSASTVSVAREHLCVTRNDRAVRCYGDFSGGGRGTDSVTLATVDPGYSLSPNGLSPALAAIGTAQGEMFGCALRTDSLIACWGTRDRGQLGGAVGDTVHDCTAFAPAGCQPGPAVVAGGVKYRQVAAAADHACATRITGEVDCWGRKPGTPIPDPGSTCASAGDCVNTPTQVTLPASAQRVVVGADHACALLTTGAAYCWGDNASGQLGRPGASSLTPVEVSGGFKWSTLSAGYAHTCGIELGTGVVGCWGANEKGQLGDGTTVDRDHPVAVVAAE